MVAQADHSSPATLLDAGVATSLAAAGLPLAKLVEIPAPIIQQRALPVALHYVGTHNAPPGFQNVVWRSGEHPPSIPPFEAATVPISSPKKKVKTLGKPRALYLFAGLPRKSDIGQYLRKHNWEVEEVDILRGHSHDLSRKDVRDKLQSRIRSGAFAAVVASPPCDTFSRATFANARGPPPLRTRDHLKGFPWLTGERKRRVILGNILADVALNSILDQSKQTPGICALEFPEDLGAVRSGSWAGVRPASLWQWPTLDTIRADADVHEFGIVQSDFGAEYLKPTRILLKGCTTEAISYAGPPSFDNKGNYIGPIPKFNAQALGLRTLARQPGETGFRTTGTAAWPEELCEWIGSSIDLTWSNYSASLSSKVADKAGDSDCVEAGLDTTSPCLAAFPIFLPLPGYWIGGKGPPRKTYMLGKWKDFHDGAGLTSPGRWKAEERVYPRGKRWDILRDLLHNSLLLHVDETGVPWGTQGIQRVLLKLCCTPKIDVFPQQLIEKGRDILAKWLRAQCADYNDEEPVVAPGQPFALKLIFYLLREMEDADFEVFSQLKTGVTAGIKYPLPRNPVIYEEQTAWRLPFDNSMGPASEAENYVSLELYKDRVESLFEEEAAEGMMEKVSNEEFYRRFGNDTAISALAVIEEKQGLKIRVLHDGTNDVRINNRIRCRDKLRMPGIPEKHVQYRERRAKSQIALSLLLDFSKAHRRVKIKEEEQGFLACRLDNASTWLNKVGTFGISSAAFWWSRLAGGLVRALHGLLGPRWALEILLYADDIEITAANHLKREGAVMAVYVLLILGSPMKNSKFRGGHEVEWIGLYLNNRLYGVGLANSRAQWLTDWARQIVDSSTVNVSYFAGGVGRLNFTANALVHEKPWLGPLYAWASTIQLSGKATATVPWGIKFVLLWIAKRLSSDSKLLVTPSLPVHGGFLFKSDAKAEGGRATIGGWECRGGVPSIRAKWFYIELFEKSTPWVFAKGGDPQRVIATLELLGSLLCLVLFDFKAEDLVSGVQTISGTTDNQGNSLAMVKFMSTKWPLAPLLMELSEQLRTRSLELHLEWERRDKNREADAITNGDYSDFTASNRIDVDFPAIPWIVLTQAMGWSKEVYDICQGAKAKRDVAGDPSRTTWKRRKTAANMRLKAKDPW